MNIRLFLITKYSTVLEENKIYKSLSIQNNNSNNNFEEIIMELLNEKKKV